ncbi:MAG: hypothetical protein MUO30_10540 [Anaerolineales bacterium]|nr:hypothetical protein [Anaerolineales bacterium]
MSTLIHPRSLKVSLVAVLLTLLAFSACTRPAPEIPMILPTLTITVPPAWLTTATATLTSITTPTPSLTPYAPFHATAMVDNLNLRTNPGYLFPALLMMQKDTSLLVLGQSPGGEWIFVQMLSNEKGWVFAKLLVSDHPLDLIPFIQPENVQLLKGRVVDANNQPVTGVQFAITQGQGTDAPRNDAMTDANGDFYAFMPLTASGEWYVGYVAIACTSNLMDANCNWKSGVVTQPDLVGISITLPLTSTLEFIWK